VTADVTVCFSKRLWSIRHKGKFLDFDPSGPGGGNPNVSLQFPSEKGAMEFLTERYPDDSEEFSRSRLEEMGV